MAYDEDYSDARTLEDNVRRYEEAERNGETVYMDPDEFTDVAEYYYDSGNIQKAIEIINYTTGIFPHSNMPLIFRARIALTDEHNVRLAKELAKEVGDKADLEYLYLIAEIMMAEKSPEDADKYLQEKLDELFDEDRADFVLDVAKLFADYNQHDIAEKWLRLSDEEDAPEYKELEGRIASARGKYIESESIFKGLLDENPFSNHLWNCLAATQMMQNRIKDAITSSEYSIAINPNDDEAIINKAHGLFSLARFEEALKYFKRYTKLRPNDCEGYMCQGDTLLNLNRPEEAIRQYKRAEALIADSDEDVSGLYRELAFALSAAGQTGEALRYAEKMERTPDTDEVEALILKAHIYMEHKHTRKALKYFKKALFASNFERRTFALIAISLYDCNYYDIAGRLFKMIIKTEEDGTHDWYAYLASCYMYLGKDKEFRECLEKACKLNPVEVKLVFGSFLPDSMEAEDYYEHILSQL